MEQEAQDKEATKDAEIARLKAALHTKEAERQALHDKTTKLVAECADGAKWREKYQQLSAMMQNILPIFRAWVSGLPCRVQRTLPSPLKGLVGDQISQVSPLLYQL
jgi:hypothetical protein